MEPVAAPSGSASLSSSVDLLVENLASPKFQDFLKRQKLDLERLRELTGSLKTVNDLLFDAEEHIDVKTVSNWLNDGKDASYEGEDMLLDIHYEAERSVVETGYKISWDMVKRFLSTLNPYHKKPKAENLGKIKAENLRKIVNRLKELEQQYSSYDLKSSTGEKPGPQPSTTPDQGDDAGDYDSDVEEWKKVLKIDTLNLQNVEDLTALRTRYYHLPSHLKRCFAFCAILPKDYFFTKEELVLQWMAGGLVHTDGNKEIKEVGYNYFEELVSRSIFQQARGRPVYFGMDDLANDLARYVSGEFSVCLDDRGDSREISSKTRHLLFPFPGYADLKNCKGIDEVLNLRTFLSTSMEKSDDGSNDKDFKDLLAKFNHLRVLSVSNISELPASIDNLKYLWYLNLSGTAIKKLPDAVCTLYSLQTLILCQCRDLVELPTNLMKLINLHHVDIEDTSLQEMPLQMDKLTKLQTLTDFFLGNQKGSSMKELGELHRLEGKLRIWNLQNVVAAAHLSTAPLKEKEKLKKLELTWSGDHIDDDLLHEQANKLQPHQNVEVLAINGYGGTKLPNWLGESLFSQLVDLRLSECRNCSSFPPLGQLGCLKKLFIEGFYELVKVGSEFYGSEQIPFGSLESLTLERMPRWREWKHDSDQNELRAFPRLQLLCVRKCPLLEPSLQSPPTNNKVLLSDDFHLVQLENLRCLTVDSFHSLDSILEKLEGLGCSLNIVQKIDITGVSLEHFPLEKFPELKQLTIRRCPKLESISWQQKPHDNAKSSSSSKIGVCPNLEEISLESCPNLNSLFEGGLLPLELQSLKIHGCQKLRKWNLQDLSFVSSFIFGGCEEVESFPEEDMLLPSTLISLVIRDLLDLKSLSCKGLQCLASLEELEIENCPELQSMPEEELPSALTSFVIRDLPNLKSLRCKGLQHLTSLQKLEVENCPGLQSIPEEDLPSSLTSLVIKNLTKLTSLNYKGLQNLTILEMLKLENCAQLQYIPLDDLPVTLTSLVIKDLPNLEYLSHEGLQHLSSLKELKIENCSKLQPTLKEYLPFDQYSNLYAETEHS